MGVHRGFTANETAPGKERIKNGQPFLRVLGASKKGQGNRGLNDRDAEVFGLFQERSSQHEQRSRGGLGQHGVRGRAHART